jgi:hypothetical protein
MPDAQRTASVVSESGSIGGAVLIASRLEAAHAQTLGLGRRTTPAWIFKAKPSSGQRHVAKGKERKCARAHAGSRNLHCIHDMPEKSLAQLSAA